MPTQTQSGPPPDPVTTASLAAGRRAIENTLADAAQAILQNNVPYDLWPQTLGLLLVRVLRTHPEPAAALRQTILLATERFLATQTPTDAFSAENRQKLTEILAKNAPDTP